LPLCGFCFRQTNRKSRSHLQPFTGSKDEKRHKQNIKLEMCVCFTCFASSFCCSLFVTHPNLPTIRFLVSFLLPFVWLHTCSVVSVCSFASFFSSQFLSARFLVTNLSRLKLNIFVCVSRDLLDQQLAYIMACTCNMQFVACFRPKTIIVIIMIIFLYKKKLLLKKVYRLSFVILIESTLEFSSILEFISIAHVQTSSFDQHSFVS
jgi:hypothetical protein